MSNGKKWRFSDAVMCLNPTGQGQKSHRITEFQSTVFITSRVLRLKHYLKQFVRSVLKSADTIYLISMKSTSNKILICSGNWGKNHTLTSIYTSNPRWIQKQQKCTQLKAKLIYMYEIIRTFWSKGDFGMRH